MGPGCRIGEFVSHPGEDNDGPEPGTMVDQLLPEVENLSVLYTHCGVW